MNGKANTNHTHSASQITGLSSVHFASGTYTGNGVTGRTISLSFTPDIAFLTDQSGGMQYIAFRWTLNRNQYYATCITNAIFVQSAPLLNASGETYQYVAIG